MRTTPLSDADRYALLALLALVIAVDLARPRGLSLWLWRHLGGRPPRRIRGALTARPAPLRVTATTTLPTLDELRSRRHD